MRLYYSKGSTTRVFFIHNIIQEGIYGQETKRQKKYTEKKFFKNSFGKKNWNMR